MATADEMAGGGHLLAELPDDTDDAHFVPAPCQIACPVGTDAPSYIAYIWERKFAEAFEAITATNPFSSICGRVCDAPCEPACRRTDSDGPVQIRNLKRYVMDEVGHDHDPPAVPVRHAQSVAVVGSGPAGLTAAHDLAVAGYRVHVYEMTDRLGGMMIWGIPAFRLPPGIIQEDIDRMTRRCPGMEVHLNTALGRDVTLDRLKQRHDAVVLAIGAWWGKKMGIAGEDDGRVIDGVQFLRDVNEGARPEMPETVVVIGGGDVAMDACRVAQRLPGCKHVKVVYRRGPAEIPARRIELEGAIEEGIEFVYHTQQTGIVAAGNALAVRCVTTTLGDPDESGRRAPVNVPGTEHDIACGMVIAAVGQEGLCDDLDRRGMMEPDRVRTAWEGMRTSDPAVFAAGDGAFGGSTIVMAMNHGQRVAYYVKAYLEGREDPLPYRTPYRTRRVPVAQDLEWELLPVQHPDFLGLGADPVAFPEIETTYGWEAARKEAARCYRCDAETGSADYAVGHREDIFVMARTGPGDVAGQQAMLHKRLGERDDPFPDERPGVLDDLAFLPANLSRLVIDPYREACRIGTRVGGLDLALPFMVAGFDDAPDEVRAAVGLGIAEADASYLGVRPPGAGARWFQLVLPGQLPPSADAAGLVHALGHRFTPVEATRRGGGRPGSGALRLLAQGAGGRDPLRARRGLRHAAAGRQRRPRRALGGAEGGARPHHPARCGDDPAPARPRGGDRPGLLRRRALRHRRGQGDRARRRRRGAGRGGGPRRRRRHHRHERARVRGRPQRRGPHRRHRQHPQGHRLRGLDDGALHRQDKPPERRTRRPPRPHTRNRHRNRHPARRHAVEGTGANARRDRPRCAWRGR